VRFLLLLPDDRPHFQILNFKSQWTASNFSTAAFRFRLFHVNREIIPAGATSPADAVGDGLGLGGGEGRELRRGGFRGEGEPALGFFLQGGAPGSRERFGGYDLAQEAAPLDEEAVDIAHAAVFAGELGLALGAVEDAAEDIGAAVAVLGRDAGIEPAINGKVTVGGAAGFGQASGPAGFMAGEAVGGEEVG
jgi:hypothetical protein